MSWSPASATWTEAGPFRDNNEDVVVAEPERGLFAAHLLRLNAEDRLLRFQGYLNDEAVEAYVAAFQRIGDAPPQRDEQKHGNKRKRDGDDPAVDHLASFMALRSLAGDAGTPTPTVWAKASSASSSTDNFRR